MAKEPILSFSKFGQPRMASGRFGKYSQAGGPFVNAGEKITIGMIDGLITVAQEAMAQSLTEVPKDTGTLAASAKFVVTETVTGDVDIVLGYGFGDEINPKTRRPASEYAVPVHEITEAEHAPPTKAKFLEDPVLQWASTVQPFLAASIRAVLMAGGKGAIAWSDTASGATIASELVQP